jgi:hypothetical protein
MQVCEQLELNYQMVFAKGVCAWHNVCGMCFSHRLASSVHVIIKPNALLTTCGLDYATFRLLLLTWPVTLYNLTLSAWLLLLLTGFSPFTELKSCRME